MARCSLVALALGAGLLAALLLQPLEIEGPANHRSERGFSFRSLWPWGRKKDPTTTTTTTPKPSSPPRLVVGGYGGFEVPGVHNIITAPLVGAESELQCPSGQQRDRAGRCRAKFREEAVTVPSTLLPLVNAGIIGTPCRPGFKLDAGGNCRKNWGHN